MSKGSISVDIHCLEEGGRETPGAICSPSLIPQMYLGKEMLDYIEFSSLRYSDYMSFIIKNSPYFSESCLKIYLFFKISLLSFLLVI